MGDDELPRGAVAIGATIVSPIIELRPERTPHDGWGEAVTPAHPFRVSTER